MTKGSTQTLSDSILIDMLTRREMLSMASMRYPLPPSGSGDGNVPQSCDRYMLTGFGGQDVSWSLACS